MYKWFLIIVVKLNNMFFLDKSVAMCCKIASVKKIRPCPKNQNIPNQVSNNKMDNFLAFLYVLVITENYQIKKIWLLKLFFWFLGQGHPLKKYIFKALSIILFSRKKPMYQTFHKIFALQMSLQCCLKMWERNFFKIFHFFHSQNFPYETWILP